MFETTYAQLRFAASILFAQPFHLPSLNRLIEACLDTQREFGRLTPEANEMLGGPILGENSRREIQLRRFHTQAIRAVQDTPYYADLFNQLDLEPKCLTFTSRLPLMDNLFNQLEGLPFAPMVGWPLPNGHYGAIGLGDLLLAAVFPQVVRKAYGRGAGLAALGLVIVTLVGVMLLLLSGLWQASFPLMIALGPLMVGQYLYWRWQNGKERTIAEYWQAEPV